VPPAFARQRVVVNVDVDVDDAGGGVVASLVFVFFPVGRDAAPVASPVELAVVDVRA
jgi:hypothetical protein